MFYYYIIVFFRSLVILLISFALRSDPNPALFSDCNAGISPYQCGTVIAIQLCVWNVSLAGPVGHSLLSALLLFNIACLQ